MADPTSNSVEEVLAIVNGEAPAAQQRPEQDQAGGTGNDIPRSRMNELIEQNRTLQMRLDQLLVARAGGAAPSPQNPQPDPVAALDPEESAKLLPLLEANNRALLQELAPLLHYARRQVGMEAVESNLPGFKESLQDEVDRMFDELSPEEKRKYDSDLGAEALAARILQRRLNAVQEGAASRSTNVLRSQTIGRTPSSGLPPRQAAYDPVAAEAAVWGQSKGEFDALLEEIKTRRRR